MSIFDFQLISRDDKLYADIVRRFERWNRQETDWNWETYTIALIDRRRLLAAGRGIVNMGLVEIRGVWVEPEWRGRGVGRQLMAEIEAEAMRRGCTRAALDSYSWQAPGFYERLGWQCFGVLEYPNGTSRHWFVKELRTGPRPDCT